VKFLTVELHRIDCVDKTFDISFNPQIDLLERSIRELGIIDPVILLDLFEGEYKIVSGFSRMLVAQKLSIARIPALIYSALDLSEKELFILRLGHNYPHRKYNPVEKGIILQKARKRFGLSLDEVIEVIHPLIGLNKSRVEIERFEEVASYNIDLKKRLAEGKITLDSAGRLSKYKREDLESVLECFDELNPSSSNQRRIIEYLEEISLVSACSLKALLNKTRFKEVLMDEKMTPSQKCARFINKLEEVRFPIYSAAEKYFKSLRKKLRLPSNVQFDHAPFFEGANFEFRIKSSSSEALRETFKNLLELTSEDEFMNFFRIDEKMKEGVS